MPDHNPTSQVSFAQFSRSLERTLNQGRDLFEEMARFAQDETFHFAHMQIDHADHAFSHFRARRDLSGLVGAQQEWIKLMAQEYAASSLRHAEMFHSLAQHLQSHVKSVASVFQHRAEEMAEEFGRAHEGMARAHNGVPVEHPHLPAE